VIPIELEIENFLAYRHPGRLDFSGLHIACLVGPNGAGKSSILDAMTWSLWGKARGQSLDDLIHQGASEMRVTLTFEQDQARYKVIRQRKSGKRGATLLEFQGWDDQSGRWRSLAGGGLRETQAAIDRLLRLDYETFVNSAFLVQGRADEFTTRSPIERKQVLAAILGLSRWDDFEARAKECFAQVSAAIHRMEGRLEEIGRELAGENAYQAELGAAEQAAGAAEQALAGAEADWAVVGQIRQKLVQSQRQVDDLTRRIKAREAEISEAQVERARAEVRADRAALENELAELQARLARLAKDQGQLDTLEEVRQRLSQEAAQLEGSNRLLGPQAAPLKDRLKVLESSSEPLCPTCAQPLTEAHRRTLLAGLQAEIKDRREQYRLNRQRIQAIQREAAEIDRQQHRLADGLVGRPGLEKRSGELESALAQVEEVRRQAGALADKIGRWRAEVDADGARRAELEMEVANSDALLKAASTTQADLEQLRLAKRLADERVGGVRQKLAALETLAAQQVELADERQAAEEDLALLRDLRAAFSKRGVPAMIIETAVPELEVWANELLGRMSDGRMHVRIETQREIKTGELREALDIIISDELGSRPYELYSGGEAFRINFAIRIALSRLLAKRAGAQLRSLFIDEGFGTQDATGRDQLVSAINSIQDDFDRILVITHIDELKDAFPARIEIQKTSMGSQFELL
jgi:DNA repair protein SbcC/Rad50